MTNKYAKRGVSSKKEDVHKAIEHIDKGIAPSAFCKIIPDIISNDENYGVIVHADGAGTKSSLAYAYWKETGNLDVWKGIAQDALIMNIDDMLCAGADDNFIVSSTIGRNKHLIEGSVISAVINGFEECIDFLKEYNINIISAGGETADVGDIVKTIIVDSTVVCRLHKNDIIHNKNIQSGDLIVGLSSFGQASYEKSYNSGIGSNGLTSARHDIFHKIIGEKYPETYDNLTDNSVIYSGKYKLTDPSPISNMDMGSFVLSPTRTYAPIIKAIPKEIKKHIHGMIHCTGGGQTKVLNFINKLKIVKNNLFETPELFKIIQEQSSTPWEQMYQVFNMGHRLEIFVPNQNIANEIISISRSFNIDAKIIGYCEYFEGEKLEIISENGHFKYN